MHVGDHQNFNYKGKENNRPYSRRRRKFPGFKNDPQDYNDVYDKLKWSNRQRKSGKKRRRNKHLNSNDYIKVSISVNTIFESFIIFLRFQMLD